MAATVIADTNTAIAATATAATAMAIETAIDFKAVFSGGSPGVQDRPAPRNAPPAAVFSRHEKNSCETAGATNGAADRPDDAREHAQPWRLKYHCEPR
jgi:hypothetical protein